MRFDEVPQDDSRIYAGHKKVLYAQDAAGNYVTVQSSGWVVEEAATCDAVAEYQNLAEQARLQVRAKNQSPLLYHMYRSRMDLPLLAQVSGLWQWRIKRHFKPRHFARLTSAQLQRYADIFDIPVAELKTVPEQPA